MRMLMWILLAMSQATMVQAPTPPPTPPPPTSPPAVSSSRGTRVGTMSELMIKIIYPTSDAVFYITTRAPKADPEWSELQAKTLMLAESANLLMLPVHARDEDRWMKDAKLMLDAGAAAFKAAKAKDLAALEAVNDTLYESCVTCHQHYRTNYGRRGRQ